MASKEGEGVSGTITFVFYKPVSRSPFCPTAEARLRFLHRRCSGSKRESCPGSICSSLIVLTLTITDDVAAAPSSVFGGRNMARTFETIPPVADSPGVSARVSASRSGVGDVRVQELAREWGRESERIRGERPTDMI